LSLSTVLSSPRAAIFDRGSEIGVPELMAVATTRFECFGREGDNTAVAAGAVYVFARGGDTWSQPVAGSTALMRGAASAARLPSPSASQSRPSANVLRCTGRYCSMRTFVTVCERHPRVRYGQVHAFNNLYDHWAFYGIASSQMAQVASERNIFEAGSNTDAIIVRAGSDPADGLARSTGDLLLGGAIVLENARDTVFHPAAAYAYTAAPADDTLRTAIETGAGWQDVNLP